MPLCVARSRLGVPARVAQLPWAFAALVAVACAGEGSEGESSSPTLTEGVTGSGAASSTAPESTDAPEGTSAPENSAGSSATESGVGASSGAGTGSSHGASAEPAVAASGTGDASAEPAPDGSEPSAASDPQGGAGPQSTDAWMSGDGDGSEPNTEEESEPPREDVLDAGSAVDAGHTRDEPAADATAPAEPLLDSFQLAVTGSSTAAGEGASDDDRGWVNLLGAELEARVAGEFRIRNFSQGGTTSRELLPGSGSGAGIDAAIAWEPNLILVALAGSNDLSSGTSGDEFLERLGAMRDAAEQAGVPVFFVSTAPKDLSQNEREALRDWTLRMEETFDPCWVPIATEPHTPCFIDIFDALATDSLHIAPDVGSGDGIHLNDEGHRVIFEVASAIVTPYVCRATSCR